MLPTPLHVLYVEDEPDDVKLLEYELHRAGYVPKGVRVDTEEDFLAQLDPQLDLILSDFTMPRFNGFEALRLMTDRKLDIPFIFVSGTIGEETAVAAMQEGAADYIIKDRLARLGQAVKQALARWQLKAEKTRAEQSAARLAAIVETSNDAIIAKTLDGLITSWNPAAERLYGYTAQEVLGKHISLLFPHDRRRSDGSESYAEMMQRLANGQPIPAYETVRVRKDGRRLEVMLSISPLRDAGGAVTGASAIAHDIGQRKRTERFLKAEQAVAGILTECRNLQEASPRVLQAISECFRWEIAALWMVDREADVLRRMHFWSAPWAETSYVDELSQQTVLERGMGLAGRIWSNDKPMWEMGVSGDAPLLRAGSHRGGFGLPMRHGVETVGVIEFHTPELRESDQAFIAVLENITGQISQFCERRRTEEALRASEEQFRQLADAMPQIVWTARPDGSVFTFNERWYQYTGCCRSESPEQVWRAVVHPEDLQRTQDVWAEAVRSGVPFEIENRLREGATGRYRWFLVRSNPALDAANAVHRWYGTATDIDDQKHRLEELRISEERFRSLVVALPTAFYATDQNGRITLFNDHAVQLWGRDPDLVKDRWSGAWKLARVDGSPLPHEQSPLAVTLRQGRGVRGEELIVERPDGSRSHVLPHPEPLHAADGAIVGAVNILVDLTGVKKLEEQVRQAQKMEAIGRLAAGVAHDFNNLLTVINGYGEIMLGTLSPVDRNRALVQEILRAGERASALTRQLLAFSRQQVLCPQVLNLNLVLAQAEKMLRRLIGEDIELTTGKDPLLGNVRADAGQIEQVLLNLAVNARDAMPRGGKLIMSTQNVELGAEHLLGQSEIRPGHYILLSVSDTGCGMDRAVQARIFEPFFTTKGQMGTGLGLATVFGIVKQSQGKIEVVSEPGQGATFHLYFPRVTEELSTPIALASGPASLHGSETILLVEDEQGVRALTRHLLLANGYTVLEAANGVDAIRLFEEQGHAVDLLITDVIMPRMSGPQLADQLTKLRPSIKVLYVSGYTDDAVVRHGVLHEHCHFLQKPFNPTGLALKVREVLDGA